MTLNFNQVGKPVAMIKGGKYDKKLIYINPDLNDHDATDFKHLKIANESKFQQVPDANKARAPLRWPQRLWQAHLRTEVFWSSA